MTIPIVALDAPDAEAALALVDLLAERCDFYKVGSELFTAEGPGIVEALRGRGKDVFLDLKFHDIPNTVAAAVRSAARLGVRLVTVHLSGGRSMLEAAVASRESGGGCRVLGVSVLTSLDASGLAEAWGRPAVAIGTEVLRLAGLGREAGLDGLVCSAHEAAAVRQALGPGFQLLVPGIRLRGSAADDQARAATPDEAAAAGASYIVVGRTVTRASDPRAAMDAVHAALRTVRG